MSRTTVNHARVYIDGYDLSGYARMFGPLTWDYEEHKDAALTDAIKNVLFGQASISPNALNAFLDPTAGGAHAVLKERASRVCMFAIGAQAAPAAGDPAFVGQFEQLNYQGEPGGGFVAANIKFGEWVNTALGDYDQPWGRLLHANGAETAANTGTSDHDHGEQTTAGGYMMYQLLSSDGTVTLKVQDADTDLDGSFGDLLTSGVLDASATPAAGIVSLSKTATVERYTRWQISLGTATTASFVIAFVRGR